MEQAANEPTPAPRIKAPEERVRPPGPGADDDVVGAREVEQAWQLVEAELQVRWHDHDELPLTLTDAVTDGAAVALVPCVADHAKLGRGRLESSADHRAVIVASVLHDEDLVADVQG